VRELGRPVEVRYGEARRAVVRVERPGRVSEGRRSMVVHLNAMFARAPEEVQHALALWLRSGRRARRSCLVLDEWIDRSLERLHRERPRALALRTRGNSHDLGALAHELREREFQGVFGGDLPWPRITWGRNGRSRTRRTLRLGSFDYASRVVRLHPVLDQPRVPIWFVRYVLFHELLHAALGDRTRVGGRRSHHGPEFRRREAGYVDGQRALAWEKENIAALLVSARTGRLIGESARRSKVRAARVAANEGRVEGWVQRVLF